MSGWINANLVCLAVLSLLLLENGHSVVGCTTGWTFETNGCFKYFSDAKDWLSAQLHCVQEGGYLAKYDDPQQIGLFTGKLSPAWIGVVIAGANWDNPKWFDGTAAVLAYWATGEPSNNSVACVVEDNGGNWLTAPCSLKTGFVCREGSLSVDPTRLARASDYILEGETNCPWDANPGAVYVPDTGYCYVFFSSPVPSATNAGICPSLNGVVIEIVNEEENKFLTAKIVNSFATYEGVWLGNSATAYSNWFPGEPNEGTGCYGLFVSNFGTWGDQDCSLTNMPVACRINSPGSCSDDSYCVQGVCKDGACVCSDGWFPAVADAKCTECTTDAACEHGSCVTSACTCDAPWVLDPSTSACTTVSCVSNPECGAGSCQGGLCVCSENWEMSEIDFTCSVYIGVSTAEPTTATTPAVSPACASSADCVHGTCSAGVCNCDVDWTKDADGKCTVCSNDVACIHGVCSAGICDCSSSSHGFNYVTKECTSGTPSSVKRSAYRRSALFQLLPGGALTGHSPLENLQTRGVIQCAHSCVKNTACYSFNYDSGGGAVIGTCELFDNIYGTSDLVAVGDVQYFKVDVIT